MEKDFPHSWEHNLWALYYIERAQNILKADILSSYQVGALKSLIELIHEQLCSDLNKKERDQ